MHGQTYVLDFKKVHFNNGEKKDMLFFYSSLICLALYQTLNTKQEYLLRMHVSLAGVFQLVGVSSHNQKVVGSIPGQDTYLC